MLKNYKTVTLLVVGTLTLSNWVMASIHEEPTAAFVATKPASLRMRGPAPAPIFESAGMLLAQVGDLLRDTIRRQIRQRLETGEFEGSELGDDAGQGSDEPVGGGGNENSSPDDKSEDTEGSAQDNSDDISQDNADDISQDNADDRSDDDSAGKSGRGSSGLNRGPRGSFDSQF